MPLSNLRYSLRFVFSVAALVACIAAQAATPSFNFLSCCPGEDTATQARFVWHSDSDACKFYYAKASASGSAMEATCAKTYKPVTFRNSNVNYYKYTSELSNLEPGTEYIYYVKSGSAKSVTQKFKTAGTSGSYNFLWLSDVHSHPDDSAKTNSVNKIIANAKSAAGSLDFVLFSGDMVKFGARYDNWQQWNGNTMLTDYMHALCPGNKEYYYNGSSNGVNGTSSRVHNKWFLACRNNPQNGADGIESSYWFIRDGVMFVAMDTMADEGVDMDTYVYNHAFALQTNWFDRVVSEQKNKKSFRYLVVFQHYPQFTYTDKKDDGTRVGFKYGDGRYKKWRDLFDKYKVDFVLTGDHHNYSRSKQLRSNAENGEGTVYITAPEIGTSLYDPSVKTASSLDSYSVTSGDNPEVKLLMATANNGNEAVGGVWFSVTPTKMTMRYIGNKATPYDSVEVSVKDRGFTYNPTIGGDDPPTPTLTEYTWKGGYDASRIGSGKNWEEGEAPAANAGVSLTFPLISNITVSNEYSSLSVKKITFPASNNRASFVGGPISVSESIVNNASVTNKFKNAVTFSGNIDVTGNIDFAGGVTGTVPANHTTFRGNYNLTTCSWTPVSGSLVPSGSTLSMPNGTFYCHIGQLTIENNATVTASKAKIDRTSAANMLGRVDGIFKTTGVFTSSGANAVPHCLVSDTASEGLVALGGIKIEGAANVCANVYGGRYQVAIGDNGLKKSIGAAGRFLLRDDGKPENIGSCCGGNDFRIAVIDGSNDTTATSDCVIFGSDASKKYNVNFDTTDCLDGTKSNGIRVQSPICGETPANVSVGIGGSGWLKFENTAVNASGLYSGGTVASNSVNVILLAGTCPGRGDLSLHDTSTLSLPDSTTGAANVFGTLTANGGTRIEFGGIASGTTPLSVGGLVVGSGTKPVVAVSASGLSAGTYPLITSALATSATGDSFTLSATGVASGNTASLVKSGNDICLRVRSRYVWTGGAKDGNLTNPDNWEGGAVPADASNVAELDLSELPAGGEIRGDVAIADGATLVLPEAGIGTAPLSIAGDFTAASDAGGPVYVQLGNGEQPVEKGFYVLMEAARITGVQNLMLSNHVATTTRSIAENGYEFAVYGGEGRSRLVLFVQMEPPSEWVNESIETHKLTGGWAFPVEYDSKGWADVAASSISNSFIALQASTGRVVMVETRLVFGDACEDDSPAHAPDGAKVGVRIGKDATNDVFQLYTSVNDSPAWVNAAADGVVPSGSAEYSVRLVLDETNRTYTAAVSTNAAVAAYAPLKAVSDGSFVFNFANKSGNTAVSSFEFVGDGKLASIIGTCTDVMPNFGENEVVTLAGGGVTNLTEAQAAWLSGIAAGMCGDRALVVTALANVSPAQMEDASLLNLDITEEGWNTWSFEVTGISVVDKADGEREISVGVNLVRDHAVQSGGKSAPINGTLTLYSYDLASKKLTPIAGKVTLGDATFSDGNNATITFTTSDGAGFIRARIE